MKFISNTICIFLLLLANIAAIGQNDLVLDKVIAVVGDEIITKSELESKYAGFLAQGMPITDNSKCEVFEDILYTKMLLNQSKVDSIEVTEGQVEGELDRRMRYFISQIGSERELEKYYKKSIDKIKSELRKSLKDQLLIQGMRAEITKDVSVTPKEVKDYYEKIPEDSLPLVNAEVEVAQIVSYAPTSASAIKEVKDKLRAYKQRVADGESFNTLAVLYSEDKGSAVKGGEIGFVGKAEVEPEFGAAAFKLKPGNVSPIVKTQYGYHIIQMIERRGTKVNVRHILLKPRLDASSLEKSKNKLDSVANIIATDSMMFEEAARKFSEDKETRNNGGIIVNPYTASSMTPMDDLDPSIFFVIDQMQVGEVSEAVQMQDPRKKPGYRLLKLNQRTEPHKASLDKDYQMIKTAASGEKEQEVLQDWMKVAIEKTYVKIDPDYSEGCEFMQSWIDNKEN